VQRKQQECNMREMIKRVKDRCNDTEKQNLRAKLINTVHRHEFFLG
jgi:hypothetical protein